MKNTMVIPLVTITFFFFGWWIYWALPNGPWIYEGKGLILDGVTGATQYGPASEKMGTNLGDRITGVFWAAFLLFSWTAASIVSGALIERIQSGAFWIMAVLIGSVAWIIDAAWGWHPQGWMVKLLGYHDAYASGVIHAIAGGFALGILVVLGPRLGRFRPDGTARVIPPHNTWLVTIGLFLIYTGFWGFYAACNIPIISPEVIGGQITGETWTATNIYLAPTSLSAITFNFLMSLSGGLMMGYIVSKGDPFWTYSCGLAGVITASAGNDLYHPIQAMLVGILGAWSAYKLHYFVERRFRLDDAVGAVAVHGYSGCLGLIVAGFLLWGQPSSPYEGFAAINPLGQVVGAVIMFGVLGFLPAYVGASILNGMGVLRVPRKVELEGLDFESEVAYRVAVAEVVAAETALVKG
jgi:ammonia channel protein AmtB